MLHRKCKSIYILFLAFCVSSLFFGTCLYAGDETITVIVAPPTSPTTDTYDHTKPRPPGLDPKEDGKATFTTELVTGEYGTDLDTTTGEVFITDIDPATIGASSKILLPDNAGAELVKHENTHIDLYVNEFFRDAQKKVENAFRGFKSMRFKGDGSTNEEKNESGRAKARAEYNKRANDAKKSIEKQGESLNQKFDDLTNHADNPLVNSAKGKAEALKERDKAGTGQKTGLVPQPQGPWAQTNAMAWVHFNSDASELEFNFADATINMASTGLFDPLLGATVSLDPIIVIGHETNHNMHLATSALNILNGDDTVLHGYLWELRYMPSNLDGYAGLIQGYLDVPPAYTEAGIINSIDSPLLDGYQAMMDDEIESYKSYFWFYTNDPLFDENGFNINASSQGMMRFGAAVIPEPMSAMLLGLGLSGLAVLRKKRA